MTDQYVAFAGRPWDATQPTHPARYVGVFNTWHAAEEAYPSVEFYELPQRSGHRRWRGWGPQHGFIVQVEELGASAEKWPRRP